MSDRIRYNLNLDRETYSDLTALAKSQKTTIHEMLRRSIKLIQLAYELQGKPNSALVIREDGHEREIMFL